MAQQSDTSKERLFAQLSGARNLYIKEISELMKNITKYQHSTQKMIDDGQSVAHSFHTLSEKYPDAQWSKGFATVGDEIKALEGYRQEYARVMLDEFITPLTKTLGVVNNDFLNFEKDVKKENIKYDEIVQKLGYHIQKAGKLGTEQTKKAIVDLDKAVAEIDKNREEMISELSYHCLSNCYHVLTTWAYIMRIEHQGVKQTYARFKDTTKKLDNIEGWDIGDPPQINWRSYEVPLSETSAGEKKKRASLLLPKFLDKKNKKDKKTSKGDITSPSVRGVQATPVPPPITPPPLPYARALYDYNAAEADELSLKVGDLICVLKIIDKNWWEGEINGRKGYFPSNYVELDKNITKDEVDEKTHALKTSLTKGKDGKPSDSEEPERTSSEVSPKMSKTKSVAHITTSLSEENPTIRKSRSFGGNTKPLEEFPSNEFNQWAAQMAEPDVKQPQKERRSNTFSGPEANNSGSSSSQKNEDTSQNIQKSLSKSNPGDSLQHSSESTGVPTTKVKTDKKKKTPRGDNHVDSSAARATTSEAPSDASLPSSSPRARTQLESNDSHANKEDPEAKKSSRPSSQEDKTAASPRRKTSKSSKDGTVSSPRSKSRTAEASVSADASTKTSTEAHTEGTHKSAAPAQVASAQTVTSSPSHPTPEVSPHPVRILVPENHEAPKERRTPRERSTNSKAKSTQLEAGAHFAAENHPLVKTQESHSAITPSTQNNKPIVASSSQEGRTNYQALRRTESVRVGKASQMQSPNSIHSNPNHLITASSFRKPSTGTASPTLGKSISQLGGGGYITKPAVSLPAGAKRFPTATKSPQDLWAERKLKQQAETGDPSPSSTSASTPQQGSMTQSRSSTHLPTQFITPQNQPPKSRSSTHLQSTPSTIPSQPQSSQQTQSSPQPQSTRPPSNTSSSHPPESEVHQPTQQAKAQPRTVTLKEEAMPTRRLSIEGRPVPDQEKPAGTAQAGAQGVDPNEYEECRTAEGEIFYYHVSTGASVWSLPGK